jgi:hypothetical protein
VIGLNSKKPSRSIRWSESSEFIKARNKSEKGKVNHKVRLITGSIIVGMLMVVWLFAGSVADFWMVLLAGIILALLIVYPVYWVFSLAPKRVILTEKVLVIDRERIDYADIDCVIIGNANFDGLLFPIISFRTSDSLERIIGLGNGGTINEVKDFLLSKDVSVEV